MSEEGNDSSAAGALQFERAEFAGKAAAACTQCQQPIGSSYYEANGLVICARCHGALQSENTHGSAGLRFLRASGFGLAAAVLGSVLYYAVRALTGYQIGLIAIVVGLMVGGAVRAGSRGRGGWLYQGLAMFLTYGSIVSSYVPDLLKEQPESAGFSRLLLVALIFVFAFAVPFLGGFQNVIGLIIIGIGLYEAWKLNRRVELTLSGPYRVASRAPTSSP